MFDTGNDERPVLHPYCRVERDAQSGTHTLIYPSGLVKLPARYGMLLKLCDGTRRLDEIVAIGRRSCSESAEELRLFIRDAAIRGWLVPHGGS